MRTTLVALAIVLVVTGAGCGGSNGSGGAPSSIVPASAYLYVEANLDPAGDQEDAATSVVSALPGVGAPARRLQEQFDAYAQDRYGRRAANFQRDIEPWLGNRLAGFALLPAHGTDLSRVRSGLVAATRDVEKARHWLFTVSRQPAERERTYKGIRYLRMGGREPLASAIVDGFVVSADEPAFKAIVDRGRKSPLAERPRFARSAKDGEKRLGLLWYDTRRLLDTLAQRAGRGYVRRALPAIRRLIPAEPLALTVHAKNKTLVLDGEVPAGKGGVLTSLFDEGGALMDQLPRDALAVVGQPNFGDYLRKLLALSNAERGGYAGLRAQLRREGLDIERDLLGWMTDAAVFLRKDRDGSLGGALVVQSGDPQAVYDGTYRLGRFLFKSGADVRDARLPGSDLAFSLRDPGLRKPLYFAEAGKRLVIGYGVDSTRAGLTVGGLGGEPRYEAARGHLGLDWGPAAYVDVERLLPILKRAGLSASGLAGRFLAPLRYLIVGGRQDGKRLRSHSELVVR
jgi:uncharacterized protein DUF3352